MLSHAQRPAQTRAERKRFIFCSFFAQKKAQKPVTLRNGFTIRGAARQRASNWGLGISFVSPSGRYSIYVTVPRPVAFSAIPLSDAPAMAKSADGLRSDG